MKTMSRKTRPVHYAAVVLPLLLILVVGAWLGPQKAALSTIGLIFIACALVAAICTGIAVRGLHSGFLHTRFGHVDRAERPAVFWSVIALSVLIGPLLLGCCMVLTRLW